MDHLQLTYEKLNVETIHELVLDDTCGAAALFVGTTRNNFENKEVISLEYEAYEPMAIKQLKLICKELRMKWSELKHIAIYHRLGLVPVKEASIVVAISSPHRQDSLQAVSYAIDALKTQVPIWKKEKYSNSESEWKENKECSWSKKPIVKNLLKQAHFETSLLKIEKDDIKNDLIQINAPTIEIERRIERFITHKRKEIDYNNIIDYTQPLNSPESSTEDNETKHLTCARTNSLIVKQENSNCHLRVRVVKNLTGPQTKSEGYMHTLDKLKLPQEVNIKREPNNEEEKPNTEILNQRLQTQNKRVREIEDYLGISTNDHKSIAKKLKVIEERLLYLESLSPEYKHFLTERKNSVALPIKKSEDHTNTDNILDLNSKKEVYTIHELDDIIKTMEEEQEQSDNHMEYEKI